MLSKLSVSPERQRPLYFSLYKTVRVLETLKGDKKQISELLRTLTDTLQAWADGVTQWEKADKNYSDLTVSWWSGPLPIDMVRSARHPFKIEGKDYSLKCFIICSFQPFYRDVVNVTTEVCSDHGIYAQTAEEIDSREILTKVCLFIDRADFAVVDVSESNPNVLLELGIVLARRKPAIIIRNATMAMARGVNIPADIVGIERIEYTNTSEDLRAKLTQVCRGIGGRVRAEKSQPSSA
jgi:hypothetical protein